MDLYDSFVYKRSRIAYSAQCAFGYFVTLLVSDAFIAKLLLEIGIDAATVGVISTLNQLSCVPSLLSIPLSKSTRNSKSIVLITRTLSMLMFMTIYLIPFIPVSRSIRTIITMLLMCGGYFCIQVSNPAYTKWSFLFVRSNSRAKFSSIKEMVSLASGVIFTFLVGKLFDKYEISNNMKGAFLFVAIMIFVINILSFVCLCLMSKDHEEITSIPSKKTGILVNTKSCLDNREFVNVIVLTTLFSFGQYLTSGFLGTYKMVELSYSVASVQVINLFGSLGRFALSVPFGIYSDRYSYAKGFTLAMIFTLFAFFASMLTIPGTRWLIVVHTVLFNISMAGAEQNSINMCFNYVQSENLVSAMAIRSCITGVCSFIASIIGQKIMVFVGRHDYHIWGIPIYGQQVLSALSVLVILIAIVFAKKVVQKQVIIT